MENTNLTTEQILEIIQEAWGDNISCTAAETILGLESFIEGRSAFIEQIRNRIEQQNQA